MKHLLNNLSEEEKNSIREQHEGGMKLDTSRFRTLLESKLGNAKPLVENEEEEDFGFAGHSGDFDGDDDFEFESPFCKSCEGTGCEECDGSGMKRNSIFPDSEENELEEDFEGGEKPLNLLQRFYMYLRGTNSEISELPDDFFNEFIEDISDDLTSDILVDTIRLNNPEFREFEERELGFAQHDGDFGGDDSDFEDEEELDLTEFDNLDEDEDTW